MQWDDSPHCGFTRIDASPWLPIAEDYLHSNVARQTENPLSMLNLYRALATLRKEEPALCIGDYASVVTGKDDIYAYLRKASNTDSFLITLNFSDSEQMLDLSQVASFATIEVATGMQRKGLVDLENLTINPNEGLLLRLA